MRLIDADALKNEVDSWGCNDFDKYDFLEAIDNAPTVDTFTFDDMKKGIEVGRLFGQSEGRVNKKSKYEFIEIFAQYVPEEICPYPEYRGKPYYSIHFRENGAEFCGFGTYKPEVLSRYLREYFLEPSCGADLREEGEP